MFDRIMERSMALWLLISAAYPVFLGVTLVKAFRHWRRARAPLPYGPSLPARGRVPAPEDWTPAR